MLSPPRWSAALELVSGSSALHVLILEDDTLLWGSWKRTCTSRSFRASFVSNVPDALRVLDTGLVEAVILDFRVGEGTSLLATGAALRAVGYARVVVLTGDAEAATSACERAGLSVRIVRKPVAQGDVLEIIRG